MTGFRRAIVTTSWRCMVGLATLGGLAVMISAAPLPPPWVSGIEWPTPKVVDPGAPGGVPSDAIVLFDGKDMSAWRGGERWKVENGYAIVGGEVYSKQPFGDCQLHLEFATPEVVKGSGQGRGNSGIHFMSLYEVQILDSFNNDTYVDGQAAAIYKQRPPLVNACRKPGEWQTYDIIFNAPRFDSAKKLIKPAYVTVIQNGVVVQNHFEIVGETAYRKAPAYTAHAEKMPLEIQYHGSPVKFRNIWIRELADEREDLLKPLREQVARTAVTRTAG